MCVCGTVRARTRACAFMHALICWCGCVGESQLPEVQRDKQMKGGLKQQVSEPLCTVGAEALSAAELHAAGALAFHTAHQHLPCRVHLAKKGNIFELTEEDAGKHEGRAGQDRETCGTGQNSRQ